jgi:hypothetical protein
MLSVTLPDIHALFYDPLKVKLYKRPFLSTGVAKGGY